MKGDYLYWLRDNKERKNDILEELCDHIWDKSRELAGEESISLDYVEQAIASMGNPKDIAREYKNRGKPKIWLTEEWFDWYIKVLIIVGFIIMSINLIVFSCNVFKKNLGQAFLELFSGISLGFLISFVLITGIFVSLSMQGFMPEDFKELEKKGEKKKGTKIEIEKLGQLWNKGKRAEYLSGGIVNIVLGFFLVFFPLYGFLPQYITPEMTTWLSLCGSLVLLKGIINYNRALIYNNNLALGIASAISVIPTTLAIPLFVQLRTNPKLVINVLETTFPNLDVVTFITVVSWILIITASIELVIEVGRAIRLILSAKYT